MDAFLEKGGGLGEDELDRLTVFVTRVLSDVKSSRRRLGSPEQTEKLVVYWRTELAKQGYTNFEPMLERIRKGIVHTPRIVTFDDDGKHWKVVTYTTKEESGEKVKIMGGLETEENRSRLHSTEFYCEENVRTMGEKAKRALDPDDVPKTLPPVDTEFADDGEFLVCYPGDLVELPEDWQDLEKNPLAKTDPIWKLCAEIIDIDRLDFWDIVETWHFA